MGRLGKLMQYLSHLMDWGVPDIVYHDMSFVCTLKTV